MLLIVVLVVLVGLRGPRRFLPLTNGPEDPNEELSKSFCRNVIAAGDSVRFFVDAEAQREDNGRKMITTVSTCEEMAGVSTMYGRMEKMAITIINFLTSFMV